MLALAAGDLEGTRADRGVTLASVEAYESGGACALRFRDTMLRGFC